MQEYVVELLEIAAGWEAFEWYRAISSGIGHVLVILTALRWIKGLKGGSETAAPVKPAPSELLARLTRIFQRSEHLAQYTPSPESRDVIRLIPHREAASGDPFDADYFSVTRPSECNAPGMLKRFAIVVKTVSCHWWSGKKKQVLDKIVLTTYDANLNKLATYDLVPGTDYAVDEGPEFVALANHAKDMLAKREKAEQTAKAAQAEKERRELAGLSCPLA
jgi:hypothetical protein